MMREPGRASQLGNWAMHLTTSGVIAWMGLALILVSHHPKCVEDLGWLWYYTGIFGLTAGVGLSEAQRRRELGQRALLEECVRDALTDPLTGLGNRRVLHTELERAVTGPSEAYWLLLIDIDNFKDVNDTHGHQAGDQVLRTVSDTLRNCVRSSDVLTRFGGEEFAILARHSSFASVLRHAGQIRHRIAATRCRHCNVVLRVTCSIGFSRAEASLPATALVEQADQALYLAKGAGRNRCAWHDGTGTALVHATARIPDLVAQTCPSITDRPQVSIGDRIDGTARDPFESLQRVECSSTAGVS
ncbi:Diguanylate cyclase DosC [Maioricimonas rarisocia]|uniref:diguanylate cyclase n=1 Tax=Maioricimonas rarisocia TaxID=2528026 RepID=A0A517ZGD4_9PLAN|nr:GGDEF domain-containing protein [Maioricimonas rarisocia]QDU41524.1 Diguanylate cyclase DosC [Maioricimonas rarisocia]